MFNLFNYRNHPTQKDVVVFTYKNSLQAKAFEDYLTRCRIGFERGTEGDNRIYFGIKKTDFLQANELNIQALNKVKEPFIADKILRYSVLIFFFLMVSVAFIGYLASL